MNILGIYGSIPSLQYFDSSFHNSSISLVKSNSYVGSFEVERFTREKYSGIITEDFLITILSRFNLSFKDIDYVAVTENHSTNEIKNYYNGKSLENYYKEIFPRAHVTIFDHHLSHAALSVLTSNFKETNFLSLDGLGSLKKYFTREKYLGNYGLFGIAEPNPLRMLVVKEFNDYNVETLNDYNCNFTLGNFYSFFSNLIYSKKNNKDKQNQINDFEKNDVLSGKIMGMSGYGYFNISQIPEIISVEKISEYLMPEFIYNYCYSEFYESYLKKLNPEQLAFWLQNTFENVILKYLRFIPKDYKTSNLCFSGGCALNVLLNEKILKEKIFNKLHVHPATSDAGLSLGSALLMSKELGLDVELPKNLGCVGLHYDENFFKNVRIKKEEKNLTFFQLLENLNLNVKQKSFEEICRETSKALQENKVVAWFQGKSEYGPRALGNRSILANPSFDNKNYLNKKIKFREEWRPYAAMVLEEYQNDWFEICKHDSYYMLFSSVVRKDKRKFIPAVTHVDYTCRIQTVNSEQNDKLYYLLKTFFYYTNIPVLLNTSFNTIKGEPIVETPIDAVKSFFNSNLDILVINDYIITKEHNETYNGEILPIQTNLC